MASPTTTLVSSLSSALPLPTITFDPSVVGHDLAFQAYCLNPPPDSCQFGPCPNSDVTGVGQQVSIYITSVAFSIILVCRYRELVRPMLYAHLGLIYSLLIATSASLGRSELTKNDGVFALLTVASPASFYLWFLTIVSLRHPDYFPVQKRSSEIWEVCIPWILKLLSLGSLIFELIMICLIFALPSRYFSQPACNKSFGDFLWIQLTWELPYITQAIWLVLIISVIGRALRTVNSRELDLQTSTSSDWAQWQNIAQADVVTWTEISLQEHPMISLPESCSTLPIILAIIQLCSVPNVGLPINQNVLVAGLLTLAYFKDRIWNQDIRFESFYIVLNILAASSNIAGVLLYNFFPTSSDFILAVVSLMILWQRCCFTGAVDLGVRRFRIIYLVWLSVALVHSVPLPRSLSPALRTIQTKSFLAFKPQPLFLNIVALPLWILAWLATSILPAGKQLSYTQMWESTMSRAHILKAGLLIITPNLLWIQSTIVSNPTRSNNMTFGQIFALVFSLVSVTSLLHAILRIDKKVRTAFLLSQPFSTSQDDLLPLTHVRVSTSQDPQRKGASADSGGPPSNEQGKGEMNSKANSGAAPASDASAGIPHVEGSASTSGGAPGLSASVGERSANTSGGASASSVSAGTSHVEGSASTNSMAPASSTSTGTLHVEQSASTNSAAPASNASTGTLHVEGNASTIEGSTSTSGGAQGLSASVGDTSGGAPASSVSAGTSHVEGSARTNSAAPASNASTGTLHVEGSANTSSAALQPQLQPVQLKTPSNTPTTQVSDYTKSFMSYLYAVYLFFLPTASVSAPAPVSISTAASASASTSQSPPQPPSPAPTSISAPVPAPAPLPAPTPAAGSASPPTPGPSGSATLKRAYSF